MPWRKHDDFLGILNDPGSRGFALTPTPRAGFTPAPLRHSAPHHPPTTVFLTRAKTITRAYRAITESENTRHLVRVEIRVFFIAVYNSAFVSRKLTLGIRIRLNRTSARIRVYFVALWSRAF